MPVVLLERLPLPSLQTYTTFSVVLLACAIIFAHQNVTDTSLASNDTVEAVAGGANSADEAGGGGSLIADGILIKFREWDVYFSSMFSLLMSETWCVWTLINMAYCCLILVGKTIQNMVFGELRVSEQQHIRDKFWNFVFYKFIFIFGVMNVQNMDEVVMWCGWFSVLGFLHLLSQLCKDRFEYLSFSPTTPKWTHIRVLMLLVGILILCGLLIAVCILIGIQTDFNTFAFMVAECVLLIINTLYVISRYSIHLFDISQEGVWENRSIYNYYTELIFELAALSVDFAHHLHMLIWGNIFLSMASLVICMQLRYLFYEFQRRIKRHKNYIKVVNSMEAKFPIATADDYSSTDDCAICWDKMEMARKLPCGHIFHSSCLRSWLEQDTTCPTCRMSLSDPGEETPPVQEERGAGDADRQNPQDSTANHFFHFDGSRYVSWLPSFSVEVTHTQFLGNVRRQNITPNQTSQLDHMARQVQGVFPNVSIETIQEDLRVTFSVEQTIENILEGRLISPPTSAFATLTTTSPVYSDAISTEAEEEDVALSNTEDHNIMSTSEFDSSHRIEANFIADELDSSSVSNESNDEPVAAPAGVRFSKSSSEREQILMNRKEDMIQQAKRKYMAKLNLPTTSSTSTSTTSTPVDSHDLLQPVNSRELAYQAAQRRITRNLNTDT
ncbi:E3 ubiquitin-protein ligase AMFR-like [Tubulanus polymorphus]|uniref:E3 ubiquitin-protein ligase AMFR-like n=1 Tax=Tubulanus polymorphus TaxID=672921 RepID=UPI003DA4D695